MKNKLHRSCVVVAALFVSVIAGTTAFGSDEPTILLFKIPDVTVHADGVNATHGTISAQLDLWGDYATNPPMIASYNVAFELAGQPASVSFGATQDPGENKLFASGNIFAGAAVLPHTIRYAKDATIPGTAVDGGLMVTVPFSVNAGVTSGTFPIQFIPGNELTNPNADALMIVLSGGTITVAASPLTGDYNDDGLVDAADYIVWRSTLGQTGAGLPADGNGNGSIDSGDYDLWQAHFGQTSPGMSAAAAVAAAIPEPATILSILAIGAFVLIARIRR